MKYRYRLERSRIIPGTGNYKLFEILEKDFEARSTLTLPALDLTALIELSQLVSGWSDKTVFKRGIVPPRGARYSLPEGVALPVETSEPRYSVLGEAAHCAHPYHEIDDHPEGVNCPTCGAHD